MSLHTHPHVHPHKRPNKRLNKRLHALLALLAALGGFIAWDAMREDPGVAGLAEAVPREHRPGVEAGTARAPEPEAVDTLPAGPRGVAVATPMAALDLFRPRRAATPEAPPPSEHEDPNEARVVGTAQVQGHWVALVEHGGQTYWLEPGQRVGGLRVDRVTARGVHVTDIARGTPQHLDLSPAGPITGLHARPHDD